MGKQNKRNTAENHVIAAIGYNIKKNANKDGIVTLSLDITYIWRGINNQDDFPRVLKRLDISLRKTYTNVVCKITVNSDLTVIVEIDLSSYEKNTQKRKTNQKEEKKKKKSLHAQKKYLRQKIRNY